MVFLSGLFKKKQKNTEQVVQNLGMQQQVNQVPMQPTPQPMQQVQIQPQAVQVVQQVPVQQVEQLSVDNQVQQMNNIEVQPEVQFIATDPNSVFEQVQTQYAEELAREEADALKSSDPMSVFNQDIELDTSNPMAVFGAESQESKEQ